MGLMFVTAIVAGFLLRVVLPIQSSHRDRVVQTHISDKDRRQQAALASKDREIQSLSRRVAVSRLLFDHFFGRGVTEQRAVVTYLSVEFPRDFLGDSLRAILSAGAQPEVKPAITSAVVSAKRRETKHVGAVEQERTGFRLLAAGDLVRANAAFAAAYRAYPEYHNVDEISHKVLAPVAAAYAEARRVQRRALLARALDDVLTVYSWGIPADLRRRLEAERLSLR
jgi:hypothetical protein